MPSAYLSAGLRKRRQGLVDTVAIALAGVTRRFGALTALDNVDLTVSTGSVFGFLGPNGAGKTTTVRLILGLLAPHAGSVRVLGLDPVRQGEAVRRQCGVVLDQPGLYDHLTASENLALAGRIAGLSAPDTKRRVDEMLMRVGLSERHDAPVAGFSKGMRQKLAIARALLTEPRLLVLDEPTSGLDPENIVLVRELLVSLAEEGGRTIFLCTHLLAEAERLCDHVAVIQRGRIQAMGRVGELGAGTRRRFRLVLTRWSEVRAGTLTLPPGATLRSRGDLTWELEVERDEDVEAAIARLVEAGAGVREVVPERETLESAYLKIVGGVHDEGSGDRALERGPRVSR
jgi:ABC-2 type transport system ATP-binding protein